MTVATGSTTNSDGRSCRHRHTKSVFPDCALADHLDHEARVWTVTAEDFDNVAIHALVIHAHNDETVTVHGGTGMPLSKLYVFGIPFAWYGSRTTAPSAATRSQSVSAGPHNHAGSRTDLLFKKLEELAIIGGQATLPAECSRPGHGTLGAAQSGSILTSRIEKDLQSLSASTVANSPLKQ